MTLTKREYNLLIDLCGSEETAWWESDHGDSLLKFNEFFNIGIFDRVHFPEYEDTLYTLTPAGRAALEEHKAGQQMKEGG